MFKIGYNTNGFTSHSLVSAIDIIGSAGYRSIAITIDNHCLNPWDEDLKTQIRQVKAQLENYGLSSIIETGARFLLDPWEKHEPTLISKAEARREYRIEFIEKCLDIAEQLGSDTVSIWSGIKKNPVEDTQAWDWLISGCRRICLKAQACRIPVAFEPEPGMFIETMDQYQMLKKEVNHNLFKLTLDVGHALITETDPVRTIHKYQDDIINIHLEDMKKNRHNHLFFGEGELDFKSVFRALEEIGYSGQVNVELSRHSHNAVETCRRAFAFLEQFNYTIAMPTRSSNGHNNTIPKKNAG